MKGMYVKYKNSQGVLCVGEVVNDICLVDDKPFVYLASAEQLPVENIIETSTKEIILPEVYYLIECGCAVYDPRSMTPHNVDYKQVFNIVSKDIEKVKMFKGAGYEKYNFIIANTIETIELAKYKRLYPEDKDFQGICVEKDNLIKPYTKVNDEFIKKFINDVRIVNEDFD